MSKNIFRDIIYVLAIGLLVTGLSGCSSSEDKAQGKYAEAYRLEQSGGTADAEVRYRLLIDEFPGTPAAGQAGERLAALEQKRQRGLKQKTLEALKSVQMVVEGYRSVMHRWPQSLSDLDDEAYFFDSDYMAEAVNEGNTVYLALAVADGFKLWSFPGKTGAGYRLNDSKRTIVEVNRKAALAEIEADYRVKDEKGALVVLVPRS